MSEIIVAEQNVCDFVRAYCYNKMSNWEALVDVYGADFIRKRIEEQGVKIDTEEGEHQLGYVYLGKPDVYIYGKSEKCTLEEIKQNKEILEVLLHEMLHKVWEEETHIACEQIGGNGEALGEGLTDWGVKKMQQGFLKENSYWKYTMIVEVLERFLGENGVVLLSKNDREVLKKAVGAENVDRFLTCLDTHLQMQRANDTKEELLDILTELIALMESGLSLEDIGSFRMLQGELEKKEAYRGYKHLVEGETGTLEYYRSLHKIIVRMQAETQVEQKKCLRDSMGLMADFLLKPYLEKLQHARQRDLQTFSMLAKSVAELTIASQKEVWQGEEQIDISTISREKLLNDPLGELRESLEALKEKWETDILLELQKNAKRPRKLQSSILEMRALMKEVKWKESDADWYRRVAEAMGVEEEKQEGFADILRMAEKEEDLENYRAYCVEYFKNGDAVFKKDGKPCSFRKNGVETDRVKPMEEVEQLVDFTLPFGIEARTYVKNFDHFKRLVLSREQDAKISLIQGMIAVEHEDKTFEYYTFNEKAEVVLLQKDLEKAEVRGDGKKKRTTLKEKMHQWFQKRFTSKTSVRLLAEGRKKETIQPQNAEPLRTEETFGERKSSFLKGLFATVKDIDTKQWERQRQKEIEKAEKKWLSGR